MADPQQPLVKVGAYSVVVVMGDPASAMVAHNVVLASSPEHAVAIVMGLSAMEGQAKMPIGNVGVIPLPEPMLRAALNGGQPGAVVPLSVVPSAPQAPPDPLSDATGAAMCLVCGVTGGHAPDCQRFTADKFPDPMPPGAA